MAVGYRVLLGGSLALLLFVTFGWGFMSGTLLNAPKQETETTTAQQTKGTPKPPTVEQKPPSSQYSGCPGSRVREVSCEALTAEATMRQADLMRVSNWLSFITIIVASAAAAFAYSAARSGTKSYKAFVAAEDACLAVEFTNGTVIESVVEGVRQPDSYFLTAKITNIGRSTARLHFCWVEEDSPIPLDFTLKVDQSEELGWRIPLESLDPFVFQIQYTSPIRTNARLAVGAMPRRVRGPERFRAQIISSKILGE